MMKIALTGGIGSGKSTAATVFQQLAIPIYFSDIMAKKLMISSLKEPIIKLLGQQAYHQNGELNTQYIATTVFSSNELRNNLNQIVHPAVENDFKLWAENQRNVPYVIIETALLLESGINHAVDKIILVTAPQLIRILRAARRDHATPQQIRKRILTQTPDETLASIADFIINSTQLITPQIINIHSKLLSIV